MTGRTEHPDVGRSGEERGNTGRRRERTCAFRLARVQSASLCRVSAFFCGRYSRAVVPTVTDSYGSVLLRGRRRCIHCSRYRGLSRQVWQ